MNKINKIKARKDVFVLNFSIFLIFLAQFAQEPCQKLEFEQAKNVTYRFEALDELIIFDFIAIFLIAYLRVEGSKVVKK